MARESERESVQHPVLPAPAALLAHHGVCGVSPLATSATPTNSNAVLGKAMREWLRSGNPPPVLLLTGARGVGKRTVAYFLAQWLFCESNPFAKTSKEPEDSFSLFGDEPPALEPAPTKDLTSPCGTCPSCIRAQKGSWVDFLEIRPEDEESETLKIDVFRDLKAKAGFGAHESPFRVILIPNAEQMTIQAANSMLKLLEEPPKDWLFVITCSDSTLLLPTIVSRCQTLKLKPLPSGIIQELLISSGFAPEKAALCARLAQGSWTKALELGQETYWEYRKSLIEFLRDPASQFNPVQEWAAQSSTHFQFLLDQLELILVDLLKWSITPDGGTYDWLNQDAATALEKHGRDLLKSAGSKNTGAEKTIRDFWLGRAARLAQLRHDALAPLNRKILIQDLLLPWLQN